MLKRFIFLIWMLLISSLFSFEAQHSVSPNIGSIGDDFFYEINLTYSDSESLLNIPAADDFYPFEVKDSNIEKHKDGDLWIVSLKFVLNLFTLEDSVIPTQSLRFNSNNRSHTVDLESIPITLKSVLKTGADGQYKIEDVTDPYVLTISWGPYIKYFIIFLILTLLLGFGLWRYLKLKNKHGQVDLTPVDTRTPLQIALDSFAVVNPAMAQDETTLKQFYLKISEITKHYLGDAYGEHVPEMTTTEALRFMNRQLGEAFEKKLNAILGQSDLVKFARFQPDQEHKAAVLQKAIDFVTVVDEKIPLSESHAEDAKS
jgi:hypothetical protein